MQASRRMIAAAVVAVAGQLTISSIAHAATVTWDGGAATDDVTLAANWVGDVLPAVGDTVVFTGAEGLAPLVSVPTQYLGLTFDANAGAFVFSGSTLTLGASPATAGNLNAAASLVTQTFNNNVSLYGGTVTNGTAVTGNLVFNGLFNAGNGGFASGNNVTFTGAATTTLNGGLTGAGTATSAGGSLTKNGTGTLIVNGDNSAFAANVFINGGALRINNANALGSGGGRIETALSSGGSGLGTLELDGPDYTLNKPVTVRSRANSEIAIRNVTGNHTISNITTGSGGNTWNFDSTAGNLAIASLNTTGTNGNRIIRMNGDGNGEFQNWTPFSSTSNSNSLSLVKSGAGTWTFRSSFGTNAANARFGDITVNGGNLVLEPGLGQLVARDPSGPAINPNVLVGNGGTLTIRTNDGNTGEVGRGSVPTTLTVQAGGTVDASDFSEYSLQIAQTLVGGGTFKVGGKLTTFGDNAIYIGNGTTAQAGTFNVQGNLSITNEAATATGGLRFDLGSTTTVGGGVNDLISIQGDLLVNNSFGAIPLYVTPLTGALATGTYRLIDFTSGTTPNASDFVIVGSSAGTTRQTLNVGTAPGQVNLVVSGTNANLIWRGDGGSNNWDVLGASNFLNGATPDRFYQFDNVTFDDSSTNQTVNLVGELLPGSVTVNSSKDYLFQGSGFINGATGITKSGTGTLTIANSTANTFTGPITIDGGALQIGNGGADGSIGAGALTNNGTLIFNKSTDVNPGLISGTGSLIKRGIGNMTLGQANTYTGATTVESGTIFVTNGSAFGDVATGSTFLAGSQLFSTVANTIAEPLTLSGEGPTAASGVLHVGGATLTTFTGPITLAASSTFRADGGASGVFTNTVTGSDTNLTIIGDGGGVFRFSNTISLGSGQFIKEGASTAIIEGTSHSWTGGTAVNGGTLQLGNGAIAGNIPAGPFTLAATGTLAFGSSAELTFSNALVSAGTIAQAAGGGITHLTGDLTGFTGTLRVSENPAANIANPNSILDVATATNATALVVADPANNGRGSGILRLSNSQAVAPTATLLLQAQQNEGTGRLELNNVNVTVAAVTMNQRNNETATIRAIAGNNSLTTGPMLITTGGASVNFQADAGTTLAISGGDITHNGGSNRIIALQGDGNGTLNNVIANNAAGTVGINVLKRGTGTWTVNGANTTIGTNTVLAGTLVYGTAAQTPVFGAGAQGIDIQGGKSAFKYVDTAAGDALAANVRSILDAGYDLSPKFSTGTIRSTTVLAQANRTLGWRNNRAAQQVEVAYTVTGDADLNFTVGFADLVALAQNYNGSDKVWSQGDFNYDSTTNFTDLVLLAQNYNQSLTPAQTTAVGQSFASEFALARTLVPEPGTLSLLGLGLVGFARRQRTKA